MVRESQASHRRGFLDLEFLDRFGIGGSVGLVFGGLLAFVVVLGLVARWVDRPLIDALVPLVDGDGDRGFAVGVAAALAPWVPGWWLLVGRRQTERRSSDEELEVDEVAAATLDEELPRRDGAGSRRLLVTVLAGMLLLPLTLPSAILGDWDRRRDADDEPSAEERIIQERMPGIQQGVLTGFLLGGALVLGPWAFTSSRARRGRED